MSASDCSSTVVNVLSMVRLLAMAAVPMNRVAHSYVGTLRRQMTMGSGLFLEKEKAGALGGATARVKVLGDPEHSTLNKELGLLFLPRLAGDARQQVGAGGHRRADVFRACGQVVKAQRLGERLCLDPVREVHRLAQGFLRRRC